MHRLYFRQFIELDHSPLQQMHNSQSEDNNIKHQETVSHPYTAGLKTHVHPSMLDQYS